MSDTIVKDHGGRNALSGMFVHNTLLHKGKDAKMKHLTGLISQTSGIPREKPIMDGVITSTKQGIADKDVPELHKTHHVGKTKPKSYGQVPYAGPKY